MEYEWIEHECKSIYNGVSYFNQALTLILITNNSNLKEHENIVNQKHTNLNLYTNHKTTLVNS